MKRILQKRKLDRIEQADLAFHQRIRQGYLSLAKKSPEKIVVVNGNQNIEQVASEIKQLLISFSTVFNRSYRQQR